MRAADETPKDEDVKAGWTAFVIFLLLIAAVVVLGFSLVKQLRKAQAAEDAGVYGATRPADSDPDADADAEPENHSSHHCRPEWRPRPGSCPVHEPASAEGVVLVLHGGASRGDGVRVSPTQLSVVRMIPTARACARAARGRLAVYRLLNTFRGWDSEHTPVADSDWAIEQVAARYPSAPVGLVGHSLGGRAALVAGDDPAVRSVVGAQPVALPRRRRRPVRPVGAVRARWPGPGRLARSAEAVARRLARRTSVGFIRIPDGKHAMVRHGSAYDRYAARSRPRSLLRSAGARVDRPGRPELGQAAQRVASEIRSASLETPWRSAAAVRGGPARAGGSARLASRRRSSRAWGVSVRDSGLSMACLLIL